MYMRDELIGDVVSEFLSVGNGIKIASNHERS